ncbi:MAG: gluconokinase [Rhodobacteraceae bacterium]|nr:gluconokinase [Paracoccaceae bacterium]
MMVQSRLPRILIMMGVSGSGKTTVGRLLAQQLDGRFIDGDDLHPPENVAKMSAGNALTDMDRWPWLETIAQTLVAEAAVHGRVVGACSALRRRYREHLLTSAGEDIRFIHLAGSQQLISDRMAERAGHFMPATLLASQFATLEPPEPDEPVETHDIGVPPADIVARIVQANVSGASGAL